MSLAAPFKTAALLACLLALTACPSTKPPVPKIPNPPTSPGVLLPSGLDRGFLVCEQGVEAGRPFVRLCNGTVMPLIKDPVVAAPPLPRSSADVGRSPTLRPAIWHDGPHKPIRHVQLPVAVNLGGQQTPIRTQTGDSCSWFAVTAGLEAAYRRLENVTLDLSEAHFQHITKLSLTAPGVLLPQHENQLGAWGGGNTNTNLDLMVYGGVGIPLQRLHPNPPDSSFQQANQGDFPDLMDWGRPNRPSQRTFDDWNLKHYGIAMLTPKPLTWTPLPQNALAAARYRVTRYRQPVGEQWGSVDWYRAELAAGREIILLFNCCTIWERQPSETDNSRVNSGKPHPTLGAGSQFHAALLVGYDDRLRVFLMKNSWGENAYRHYSYDNITSGAIRAAQVIEAVAPAAGPFPVEANPTAWIGDWFMLDWDQPGGLDAWRAGRLSIYNVPQPRGGRIGTFHAQDGKAFRVNGVLDGRRLTFWIDPANPDAAFTPVLARDAGHRYEAMLFDDDRNQIVGNARVEGQNDLMARRGFTARRFGPLSLRPVERFNPGISGHAALLGRWEMQLEGRRARWYFNEVAPNGEGVIGTVWVNGGQGQPATGAVYNRNVVLNSEDPVLPLLTTRFVTKDKTVMGGWLDAPFAPNGHVAILVPVHE